MMQRTLFNDPDEFHKLLLDPTVEVQGILPLTEEVMCVVWRKEDDFAEAPAFTNSVIAAFTSMYGRLKLYSLLERLGERTIYFDTVLSFFLHRSMYYTVQYIRIVRSANLRMF